MILHVTSLRVQVFEGLHNSRVCLFFAKRWSGFLACFEGPEGQDPERFKRFDYFVGKHLSSQPYFCYAALYK